MGYRLDEITFEPNLSTEEIAGVHSLWKKNRDLPEWVENFKTWNSFKNKLGLSFDANREYMWRIEDRAKWLWSKLQYGI